MEIFKKIKLLLLTSVVIGFADNIVHVNETFPYRIVCQSEWIQQVKNDSVLVLTNTAPGRKTRFQLQKYVIDSGYDFNDKSWSRLRYSINVDLTLGFGKLGFVDTSSSKKLGSSRAYEIFAYFWIKTDEETVWWAEYTRWTDINGIGFMASIIGDTLDMKENVKNKSYKNFLDSITLTQFQAGSQPDEHGFTKKIIIQKTSESLFWYDILGRNMPDHYCQRPNTIIVKKNMKRGFIR